MIILVETDNRSFCDTNNRLVWFVQPCDLFFSRSLRRIRKDAVSPHDVLRLLKQPRGDTRSAVRSADYMAQTLRLVQERVHHVHKRSLNATGQTGDDDYNTHTLCYSFSWLIF